MLITSLRRRVEKAESVGVALSLGNDAYIADVLNVYTDNDDQFGYVASNSLPSYTFMMILLEKMQIVLVSLILSLIITKLLYSQVLLILLMVMKLSTQQKIQFQD